MRIHLDNKISLILILVAGASLVSMLATLRIDSIVHHDLYHYGLEFSTKWAAPYWTMAAVVFSMGWLIILTSLAFEIHLLIRRLHRPSEPETPIVLQEPVQNETPIMEAEPNICKEPIQNDTPIMEAEPSIKPEEEQVITTALAVKKEEKDDLTEFRVLLEEISVMTSATNPRQKTEDKPKTE